MPNRRFVAIARAWALVMNVLSERLASRRRRSSSAGAIIGIAAATIVVRMMITTNSSMRVIARRDERRLWRSARERRPACQPYQRNASHDFRLSALRSLLSAFILPSSQQMVVNVIRRSTVGNSGAQEHRVTATVVRIIDRSPWQYDPPFGIWFRNNS